MLGRTTSLLPNALFASLGMPKDENLINVKHVNHSFFMTTSLLESYSNLQGIDHDLKQACEDVITSSADTVVKPLRTWLDRVTSFRGLPSSQKQPLDSQDWASLPAVQGVLQSFQEVCHRDLHSSVARLRLYLEDDRTVHVLLKHVQDRIVEEYAEFSEVVGKEYSGSLRNELWSEEGLRVLLHDICQPPGSAPFPSETGTSGSGS